MNIAFCPTHNVRMSVNYGTCYKCESEREVAKQKAEREQKAKELHYSAEIGDFVYNTWGYEQTNVTFWQITRKTTKCLFGQEVESRRVDSLLSNGQPAFAGRAYPIKGDFKRQETRINLNHVDLYDGLSGVSCSWYG